MFIDTVYRTTVLYIAVIAAMRLLGKRQLGELEPTELAVAILISELAAMPMQNIETKLAEGLLPIGVLVLLGILTSWLTMRSPLARKVIYGRPSIIILNGELQQREIKRLRLNLDEINEELRLKEVADISDVKYGIVETNGELSVLLKPEADSPTRADLKLHAPTRGELGLMLISNGTLMRENMKKCGITREELAAILKKRNILSHRDVFCMIKTPDGCRIVRKL